MRLITAFLLCTAVAVSTAHEHSHDHGEHHAHDHHDEDAHVDHSKSMYSQEANEEAAAVPEDPPAEHEHDHHDHDHHDHDHHDHDHHDHDHHDHDHKDCDHHDHDHSAKTPKSSGGASSTIWAKALGSTLLISLAPILMLALIPIDTSNPEHQSFLKVMLAFAAGGLLGDAFLHLIPHAINPHSHGGEGDDHGHDHGHSHGHGGDEEGDGHDHTKGLIVGLWILAGIISFLMIEMFVRSVKGGHSHGHGQDHGHGHGHGQAPVGPAADDATPAARTRSKSKEKIVGSDAKEASKAEDTCTHESHSEIAITGYLNLAADFAHNFTDGLAIGAVWLSGSEWQAYMIVFTILLHEVPHEIGDFAILLQSGCTKWQAMKLQFTTALGAMMGTVCGLMTGSLAEATNWVLPFTAGGFIYIATVSVIPALLEDTTLGQSLKELVALMTGILIMVGIVFLEE